MILSSYLCKLISKHCLDAFVLANSPALENLISFGKGGGGGVISKPCLRVELEHW